MGATQRVDIERLLIWAYREQEVDRRVEARPLAVAGGGGSNWPGATMELGQRVDVSPAGARLAAAELARARTADDALIVHDAVLTLDDMWIAQADGEATLWTVAAAAREGYEIVGLGEVWTLRPALRNGRLADFVAAPLQRCVIAPLIVQHARSATRPDWCEGWDGRAAVDWRGERDRWGRLRTGRPRAARASAQVTRDRAIYLVWRAALACLAVDLEGRLAKWAVCGPCAPDAPWEARDLGGRKALSVQTEAASK